MSILCIGEMLIDFIGENNGESYIKKAGGSVSNVASVCSILGTKSYLLTNLGDDLFGHYLYDIIKSVNIQDKYVNLDKNSFTPLAFVSLNDKGDRSFSFYFKGSSALNITNEMVDKVDLTDIDIIHFSSIAIQGKSKEAHLRLIKKAKNMGIKISFDVNLRFSLWEDKDAYYKTIMEFIPLVDIIKISDNELEFVTSYNDIKEAREKFLSHIEYVLYTQGENGSIVYKNKEYSTCKIPNVNVVDTTGAGDAFVGAFLSKLLENKDNLDEITKFATHYASYSTTKKGAIPSYETIDNLRKKGLDI